VITCWNGRKLLEKNLPKVFSAWKNPRNKIREVIVVDDGSSDDSGEYVNKFQIPCPSGRRANSKFQIRLVRHKKNLGYAATCNTGVREAEEELVVILNLDVIPSRNFLEYALPHFKDEEIFAVSFNEGKFGPGKLVWKNGFLEIEKTALPQKTSLTDWPSGGSSIFRKKIWEELGGMDKLFLPFYFEDIDIGLRARKLGYKCLWEPKAKVVHQHEATINPQNFNPRYIDLVKQRNHLLLTWKNLNLSKFLISHLPNLVRRCVLHPKYSKIVFLAAKKWTFQ